MKFNNMPIFTDNKLVVLLLITVALAVWKVIEIFDWAIAGLAP